MIIAARNMEAASEAKSLILQSSPSARVDVLKLDLSSLKSVREFADEFLSMDVPLNILMYVQKVSLFFFPKYFLAFMMFITANYNRLSETYLFI